MQSSGRKSLRKYMRELEAWQMSLGRDVTMSQRIMTVLDHLDGGARTLFVRIPLHELMQGVVHNGRLMPPLEFIVVKLYETFGDDDEGMRRQVDTRFANFHSEPREEYRELILRYESARLEQVEDGIR